MRPGLDPEPRTHPYGFRPLGATNLNLRRRNLRSLDLRRRNLGTCTLVAGVNLRRRNLLDLNLRRRNSVRLELNRRRRKSVGQPLLDLQLSFARRALDQLVEVRRIEMRRQQANSDQMEPAIGDGLEELGELASSPRGLNPLELKRNRRILDQKGKSRKRVRLQPRLRSKRTASVVTPCSARRSRSARRSSARR